MNRAAVVIALVLLAIVAASTSYLAIGAFTDNRARAREHLAQIVARIQASRDDEASMQREVDDLKSGKLPAASATMRDLRVSVLEYQILSERRRRNDLEKSLER